jgi:hypothetical protein
MTSTHIVRLSAATVDDVIRNSQRHCPLAAERCLLSTEG